MTPHHGDYRYYRCCHTSINRWENFLTITTLFMTYWHKVQMSCRQTQPVVLWRSVRFRHGSLFLHQASGRVNSSSARALCGIGIAAFVATFLVSIFHLPPSRSYLASLEKASPTQTWPAECLRSRELEDTCTNADGWHEWKWFQIGNVVFGFPTRQSTSIRGAFEFLGGHKSRCVCVCAICDRVQLLTLAKVLLCALFYRFHFRFRNRSRWARRGEESGGHSNSFVVCNKVHRSSQNKFAECRINCIFLRSNLPI